MGRFLPRKPRKWRPKPRRPLALAEVTALRRAGPGRVALEVDGRPWRTVPDEVVLRARLSTGATLDRPVLRLIRAELARARARSVAGRALARRDLSSAEVAERLSRARVGPRAGADVLASLEEAGLVDDARAARARAASLAERGYGDVAITARLEAAGIGEAIAAGAIEALEPEATRAVRVAARERDPVKAARLLSRRGFDPEVVEELFAALDSGGGRGLG